MQETLEELKQKINNLDEYNKLYLLGFISGLLFDLKGFGGKDEI